MTGELTLHDRITAVGGIKTKLLAAAATTGLRRAVLPEDNQLDVEHDFRGDVPPSRSSTSATSTAPSPPCSDPPVITLYNYINYLHNLETPT